MASVFLTGFPGFLGSSLVERLLDRYPTDVTINCLIQAKFRAQAEKRIEAIEGDNANRRGRIILFEGDISAPDLGLGDRLAVLQEDTVEVFHLAAVYDLGVSRELSMKVNVDGTRHLIAFAQGCPQLTCFQYVSTCYVSGKFDGTFTENDLAVGQTFNNFYEETKYLAEVEVQIAMRTGLPVTIYRPAIVVGDSETGETQKYDGPYYLIQLIARQMPIALVPMTGNPREYQMNIVPRDFVVNAIDYLSAQPSSRGVVYQLAMHNAPTIDELVTMVGRAVGRPTVRIPLPKRPVKFALEQRPIHWLAQIEPESLEYFTHPTRYTAEHTMRDLADSGIFCPPLNRYIDNLVTFWRANRHFSSAAMV